MHFCLWNTFCNSLKFLKTHRYKTMLFAKQTTCIYCILMLLLLLLSWIGIFYHTIYVIAIFKQTNSHLYWITGITLCCTNQHFMKLLICRTLCTSWGWQLLSWYFYPIIYRWLFLRPVFGGTCRIFCTQNHTPPTKGWVEKKPFPTVGAAVMSPAHATEARKMKDLGLSFSVVKAVRWKGSRSIANTP